MNGQRLPCFNFNYLTSSHLKSLCMPYLIWTTIRPTLNSLFITLQTPKAYLGGVFWVQLLSKWIRPCRKSLKMHRTKLNGKPSEIQIPQFFWLVPCITLSTNTLVSKAILLFPLSLLFPMFSISLVPGAYLTVWLYLTSFVWCILNLILSSVQPIAIFIYTRSIGDPW